MKIILNLINILIVLILFNTPVIAGENFFSQGKAFYEKKNLKKAKFKFEQDIVFNPKNELSYLYLAKIYNKEKNFDKEEINLNTVLLLDPQNEEATYDLISLNILKSDFSNAQKYLDNFTKICKRLCNKKTLAENKLKDSLKR